MSNSSRAELVKGILDGSIKWEDYLKFSSNMWAYEADEMTEIYQQNPSAVSVATIPQWNNMGFHVLRGERGLRLSQSNGSRDKIVFDVKQTNAPDNYNRWTYKPEAADLVRQEWNRNDNFDFKGEDIIDDIFTYSYTALELFKKRYGNRINNKYETILVDSIAYSMMVRMDLVELSDTAFDFSELRIELQNDRSNYNEFNTFCKYYRTAIYNAMGAAKKAINRYDEQREHDLAAEEKAIADRELFNELTGHNYLYDNELETRTVRVDIVDKPYISVTDVVTKEQFQLTIEEFNDSTTVIDEEQVVEVSSETEVVVDAADEELLDYAESVAEQQTEDNETTTVDENILSFAQSVAEQEIENDEPEIEQPESDVQLSFFSSGDALVPTKPFKQTPARRQRSTVSDSQLSVRAISDDMINYVLCCASPDHDSREKIIAYFQKGKSVQEKAKFLRYEFGDDGSGYVYGDPAIHLSAWFNDDGIKIAAGDDVRASLVTANVTWETAAQLIDKLLDSGRFSTQEVIDRSADHEIKAIADRLWYLHQDLNKEKHSYFIPDEMFKGGFPDSTERIAEALHDKDILSQYVAGLTQFCEDYENDHSILRFNYHRPNKLLADLSDLQIERKDYKAAPDFTFEPHYFISEEEKNTLLRGNWQRNFAVSEYFESSPSLEDKIRFLKNTYGIGGRSLREGFVDYDSKGICLKRGNILQPDCQVLMKWGEVVDRYEKLISEGRLISESNIQARLDYAEQIVNDYNPAEKHLEYEEEQYKKALKILGNMDIEDNEPENATATFDNNELLDSLLSSQQHLQHSKNEVVDFFANNLDDTARADYISGLYAHGVYTELLLGPESVRAGYIADESGMLVWEGNYLTRTSENSLSWADVSDRIARMVYDDKYLDEPHNVLNRDYSINFSIVRFDDEKEFYVGGLVNEESITDTEEYQEYLYTHGGVFNVSYTYYNIGEGESIDADRDDLNYIKLHEELLSEAVVLENNSFSINIATEQEVDIKPRIMELTPGDVILYENKRMEIQEISDRAIRMRDLDAPVYGGIVTGQGVELIYDGWQEDMESKGFELLSKASEPISVIQAPANNAPQAPASVKNLSQLKKAVVPGMIFEITEHLRPECVGERRIVTSVNTVGFTSKKFDVDGNPTGRDIHMEWDKASNWTFTDNEFTSRQNDGSVLMSFHFLTEEQPEQSQAQATEVTEPIEQGEPAETISVRKGILTLHKVGDFYELYGEQANIAAEVLGIHITTKNGEPMTGFPEHTKNDNVLKLSAAGYDVLTEISFDLSPRSNVVDVVANRNFKHLFASFPALMSKQYRYMQLSAGEAYDKLNLEWITVNRLSMSHTFIQNGDVMRDPDIVLLVNFKDKLVYPVEYQNDTRAYYREYEAGDPNSKDCNSFVATWLRNIDAQGFKVIRSVRSDNQDVDIEKEYDRPLDEDRYDLYYVKQSAGIDVYDRLDVVEADVEVKHRHTATIFYDGNITYYNNLVPDFYRQEISNYARRLDVDTELFAAYTLMQVFNDLQHYRYIINDRYDLKALNNFCEGSSLYDHDFKEYISETLQAPQNADSNDLKYAVEVISSVIENEYQRGEDVLTYADIDSFVKDVTAESEIFNQLFIHLDVNEALNRQEMLEIPGVDNEITEPEPAEVIEEIEPEPVAVPAQAVEESSDPLVIEVGSIVTAMGSDREFVVTEINTEAQTATIRDDNTGWYPLFQELPLHQLSAIVEQKEALEAFENASITPAPNVLGNYIITDDALGEGGPKAKAADNIAAIELINKLATENRNATEEERNVLARFVGWGSLPDVFDERKDNFSSERARLQELLSEKEYQSARESTLTAFYTQPVIIRSIYQALDNFGFKGGRILEPSMGVGNFFGVMPQELAANSQLYGVELDRITGNIAKQLYPNANIQVKGFEDFKAADNSFDVAVGNVPFANFKLYDPRYNSHNLLIHDYFFVKTLDKVKPGGIVAFITSKGTLDKQNSKVRKMLCERAELIGAIRLPSTAFKANAGTEAISDIIFLKKRESIQAARDNWIDTTYSEVTHSNINNYFIENPDMICGTLTTQSTQFGYDIDVQPFEDITLEEALAERIGKLQGKFEPADNIIDLKANKAEKQERHIALVDDSIAMNCYGQLPDGTIVYRDGHDSVRVVENIAEKNVKIYRSLIRLSKAVRHVINVQQVAPDGFNDDIINKNFELAKAELNEAYNRFAAYKLTLHTLPRTIKFKDDHNWCLMQSLENEVQNPDGTKSYVKGSALFEKRTIIKHKEITHCDSINDAFIVSMNTKSRIDLEYICKLTDKPINEVVSELDGTYMYRNPEKASADDLTIGWEPVDEYLSGNIRTKLQIAKNAAETDSSFAKNVLALEGVMPEPIPATQIAVQLGSSWLPPKVIDQFIQDEFQLPRWTQNYITVEHDIPTATWYIKNKKYAGSTPANIRIYGSGDMSGLEVLEASLNQRRATIYDRVKDEDGVVRSVKNAKKSVEIGLKQDALNQAFIDWIWKDPVRTRDLSERYNVLYNSERVRRFDGSHLTFDGMNPEITMQPHQKNAVARVLYGGNTLLAHVVGAGKTFEIAACCMELKRTGAANKALIVAPNHLLGQWQKEFLTLYPGANILVATSEDFQKDNRKRFIARMATGEYDAIIMGYSTFSKIAVSPERRRNYYNDEIDACIEHLDSVEKGSLSEKQLQKYKKELEGKLKSMEYVVKQDNEIYFEELGVDWLYVDEAHNFKNLQMNTKLGRVAGVQTSRSKRAEDMLLKIRYINELQGAERGVVLATGTPISNSLVEMYTMQRYLQPEYLNSKGIGHFDSWAADFAKIETSIELNPTGIGFRSKTRCSSFNNLPELMVMFNRCTDIQTAEMLDLPVPKLKGGQYSIYTCEPSDEQKAFIKECGHRADRIHQKKVDPSEDNMLCVTNDGKMCALDMRLIDPEAEDRELSKVNVAIDNIFNKWVETKEDRLTQIVFLDKSTPKPDEFNLYDDIRDKLVLKGIPREEISFIHEAKNDAEKLKMFDNVNAGKIRIIIGSTEKMGAGTNIQTKLCALHHLDVPWRPSDIEQREGRILRRGNENKEVEIFRYVTEGTFDAYSWQTIESKQRFISQVMTGEAAGRSAEDVDDAVLNYAQIKALATGDPRIKEHFDLTEEVNKLKVMKGNFDKAHVEMRDRLAFFLPKEMQKETRFVKLYKAEKEYAENNSKPFSEDNPFNVMICGKKYDERAEARKKILEIINSGAAFNDKFELGTYRGFELSVQFSASRGSHVLNLHHNTTFTCEVGESSTGVFSRLDTLIDRRLNEHLIHHSQELANIAKEIEFCKEHANEKFPQEDLYIEKSKKLEALTKELAFDKHSEGDDLIESDVIQLENVGSRK